VYSESARATGRAPGIGCFGLVLLWIMRGAPAVSIGDPQLNESLQYKE